MKKITFTIILLLLFIGVASAEKCTIVSGSGTNIGDEIACGTEHFYVINNDGKEVKMLAKYNLYVGYNIDKIKIDAEKTYVRYECNNTNSCYANRKYFSDGEEVNDYYKWIGKFNILSINDVAFPQSSNWDHAFGFLKYSDTYTLDGKMYKNSFYDKLYPYQSLNEEMEGYGIQNELARGVTGEKGNANYPLYGVTYLFERGDNQITIMDYENFENGYTNLVIDSKWQSYYKDFLLNEEYNVSEVDMITIEEIKELVNKITNKQLPLSEWYELSKNNELIIDDDSNYYNLGDLKEYLSDDYSWLWNTTYWTRTAVGNINNNSSLGEIYFISSSGDICYSSSDCQSGIPRAGIRPVVTLPTSEIDYRIEIKTDGNGEVKSEKLTAAGGEVIKFTLEPKEGYVLGSVKVTDANGNVVYFKDYTFTMPNANVLIEATFVKEKENPKTADIATSLLFIALVLSTCLMIYNKKRLKEIE